MIPVREPLAVSRRPVGGKRADLNLLANNAEVEQVLMRITPNPHDAHLEREHA
jgi:hypothetical protein